MAASTKEMRHADEPSAVPARAVDTGVPVPVRNRGTLRSGADRQALAPRLWVPALRGLPGAHELPAAGVALLAVRRLPVPVQGPQRRSIHDLLEYVPGVAAPTPPTSVLASPPANAAAKKAGVARKRQAKWWRHRSHAC